MELTPRQSEMLEFIRSFIAENRYPPTVRDIGLAMGIRSPNGVACHLKELRKKGVLTWEEKKNRSIRLLDETCPYCGSKR